MPQDPLWKELEDFEAEAPCLDTGRRWSDREIENQAVGGCPICHYYDYYLNVGRHHWAVCEVHGLRWHIGENVFSSWRHEDDVTWSRNAEKLNTFKPI